METRHIVAAVMLVALLNGMFSPDVDLSFLLVLRQFPILRHTPAVAAVVAMQALAVITLLLSGVPAALYERVTGTRATPTSAWIWLVGALVLSLPTIMWRVSLLTRP